VRLNDILQPSNLIAAVTATDKQAVLAELCAHACHYSAVDGFTPEQILSAVLDRERLGSTGVGQGIAIPHARLPGLARLTAVYAQSPHGIPFDAIDQEPVTILFLLLVPESSSGLHLKALARIARLLKGDELRRRLRALRDPAAIYQLLLEEDNKVGA